MTALEWVRRLTRFFRGLIGVRLAAHPHPLPRLATAISWPPHQIPSFWGRAEPTSPALQKSKKFCPPQIPPPHDRRTNETGLLYLNARYMNPAWGRFISPDDWDAVLEGARTDTPMR